MIRRILYYLFHKSNLRQEYEAMGDIPNLPENLLKNSRVFSTRKSVLDLVPKDGIITEVGVYSGEFTKVLLDTLKPKKFHAIDLFPRHHQYAEYVARFKNYIDEGVMAVHSGLSWDVLAKFPGDTFDFVYLDADHSYESLVKDLRQIKKTVKTDGMIQFNDYTTFSVREMLPYGIRKAVNEFLIEEEYEIIGFGLELFDYHDVLVRKLSE